jgi:chemotaxis protein MotA
MFYTKRIQIIFSIIPALGLWLMLILFGSIFSEGSGMHRFFEIFGGSSNGFIQAFIYAIFFYSLFEIAEKRKFIQQQQKGFQFGLLPLQDQLVLSPDEVAPH